MTSPSPASSPVALDGTGNNNNSSNTASSCFSFPPPPAAPTPGGSSWSSAIRGSINSVASAVSQTAHVGLLLGTGALAYAAVAAIQAGSRSTGPHDGPSQAADKSTAEGIPRDGSDINSNSNSNRGGDHPESFPRPATPTGAAWATSDLARMTFLERWQLLPEFDPASTPVGAIRVLLTRTGMRVVRKVRHLGEGGYGFVVAMEEWHEGEGDGVWSPFALKWNVSTDFHLRSWREEVRSLSCVPSRVGGGEMEMLWWGQTGSHLFIALQLFAGGSVYDGMVDGGILSVSRCLWILLDVCSTLNKVHEAGGLHRDIKPENILLEGRHWGAGAVLGDWGLGAWGKEGEGLWVEGYRGTPGFMAPEVMADLTYGPPADVFSLGATAFFLVTGKQMFFRPGETFFLPQWDDAVWETLPGEALRQVVLAMCTMEASTRPTAADLLECLLAMQEEFPLPDSDTWPLPASSSASPLPSPLPSPLLSPLPSPVPAQDPSPPASVPDLSAWPSAPEPAAAATTTTTAAAVDTDNGEPQHSGCDAIPAATTTTTSNSHRLVARDSCPVEAEWREASGPESGASTSTPPPTPPPDTPPTLVEDESSRPSDDTVPVVTSSAVIADRKKETALSKRAAFKGKLRKGKDKVKAAGRSFADLFKR